MYASSYCPLPHVVRASRDKLLPLDVHNGIFGVWVCRMSRAGVVGQAGCGWDWVLAKPSADPAVLSLWVLQRTKSCPGGTSHCSHLSSAHPQPEQTRRIPRTGITLPHKVRSEKISGFCWMLPFGNICTQEGLVGPCHGQHPAKLRAEGSSPSPQSSCFGHSSSSLQLLLLAGGQTCLGSCGFLC